MAHILRPRLASADATMPSYVERGNFIDLAGPFEQWPELQCPRCRRSVLEPNIQSSESISSIEARLGDAVWDGWTEGHFFGTLSCARTPCGNKYVVAGNWSSRSPDLPEQDDFLDDPHLAGSSVRHILPPLPVMPFPDKTPDDVRILVQSASSVLLSDTSAAANRMRSAVESLLDARKVRRLPPGRRGAKYRLSTDRRIKEFSVENNEVADLLMAIKWIGNAGSHESRPLSLSVVLDGIELFAHAIHLLYDDTPQALQRRAARINRRRGPDRR